MRGGITRSSSSKTLVQENALRSISAFRNCDLSRVVRLLGPVQESLRVSPFTITFGDLGTIGSDLTTVLARDQPARNCVKNEHQGEQPKQRQTGSPSAPELPYIFVRLACEIDIQTHN